MATAQLNLREVQQTGNQHQDLYQLASRFYQDALEQDNHLLLADAAQLAEQAWQIKPNYAPGLNLLCRIELQRRNTDLAWRWVSLGLSQKPDSINLLYSAGHVALAEQDLEQAQTYFSKAYRISRVATKAGNYLAHIALVQQDYLQAFQYYRELIKTQAKDPQVKSGLFSAAEKLTADFYSDELEQDLLRYLDFHDVDYSQLRPLASSLLKHKLQLSEAGSPLELETLASDPLLLTCLEKFYFCDPILERLLITLRQSVFISSAAQLSITSDLVPLVSAIGHQTFLNESVWYQTEQESKLADQLHHLVDRMIKMPELSNQDLYPILLLLFMYRVPQQCKFADMLDHEALAWPIPLGDLIEKALMEAQSLQAKQQHLTSFGNTNNQVSEKVANQYNNNPYPRWSDIGYSQPSSYWQAVANLFPTKITARQQPSPIRALVAGSGTGRHALRLARYFHHMEITALDLSHQALAYAQMKADQYQVENIDFIQGDILLAERLGQQFDVIECSGVLHHMQDPQTGLNALVKQLKGNGLIKIALYSTAARANIIKLRNDLEQNMPTEAHDMRLIREAMLQGSLTGDWSDIFNSADFYSLSACRDLLFHQQEHTYTCAQLQQLLDNAELEFIGMIPQGESEQLAQQLFNKAGHQLTLEQWGELEHQKPELFAAMYQFYARKPI
ncbi:hypothetical protein A3759_04285 [Thalassolituus sp. HI0120]|nr:hypothetical protein A3759_04285 [Thalassolituus sp. HI0120]